MSVLQAFLDLGEKEGSQASPAPQNTLECPATYIGETKNFPERIRQHKNDVRTFDIPPSIVGSDTVEKFHVEEGKNFQLTCSATGQPQPVVTWRRTDGEAIYGAKWHESYVEDRVLNLTRVSREEMGGYVCIASNGIPPTARMDVLLEVRTDKDHRKKIDALNI
ncbi:hypothetical protein HPB47_009554 [Ixodes persulcatus]|uniref:Uncharacterized protein n=1 Tax=Ixodes persulcatus TaxID=34615 RepID=A0AC60P1H5_IXOPE|nr:hypothetical protein HPB47_009554 [Ixodes persulcatus]